MNYFTPESDPMLFACPCGNCDTKPSEELITMLNAVREEAGIPMYITSGPRCIFYNIQIGGSEYSEHPDGDGGDVQCSDSRSRFLILAAAFKCGVRRIGLGKTFIHLGVSIVNDQDVAWSY